LVKTLSIALYRDVGQKTGPQTHDHNSTVKSSNLNRFTNFFTGRFQWRSQDLEIGWAQGKSPSGVQGQSHWWKPPPRKLTAYYGFGCQTMQNFVYFATKVHEPLVMLLKNLGSSACLFAVLSIVIDRANNYSREFCPDRIDICFCFNYWSYELNRGVRRTYE